jgi:hypothetical protein
MRTEIREVGEGMGIAGSRRGRIVASRFVAEELSTGLEPLVVDAALADETMQMHDDRGSRRDASHAGSGSLSSATADDQLLRSLSAQLELLSQQQHEIRRLLDQAGHRRVDRIAN